MFGEVLVAKKNFLPITLTYAEMHGTMVENIQMFNCKFEEFTGSLYNTVLH